MRVCRFMVAVSVFLTAVSASAAPLCSVGDKAHVLWQGKWYQAKVTKVNETQTNCYIRYDGYGAEWDEWVGSDRFRKIASGGTAELNVGSSVSCNWKGRGQMYPGVIAERDGNAVFIHYNDGDKELTKLSMCRPR